MDNSFNNPTQKPGTRSFGQPLRPIRPTDPRPMNQQFRSVDSFRPAPLAQNSLTPHHQQVQRPVQVQNNTQEQHRSHALSSSPQSHAVHTEQIKPTPVHQPVQQPVPKIPQQKKPKKGKRIVKSILIVTVLAACITGAGLYYVNIQKQLDDKDKQIAKLRNQFIQTREDNKDLTDKLLLITDGAAGMTQTERDKVMTAVISKNYEQIKQYLGSSTLVILAASEGVGRRTATQAIEDLKFLDSASQPWNFALPEETYANYRDGDYAQYFPDGAIIGKSADNKIVSFSTTPGGKINVIFMCSNESLL